MRDDAVVTDGRLQSLAATVETFFAPAVAVSVFSCQGREGGRGICGQPLTLTHALKLHPFPTEWARRHIRSYSCLEENGDNRNRKAEGTAQLPGW